MTFRSSFLGFLILLCLSGSALASERSELYDLGKQAYDQGNYVTALKNLSAFYVLNEEDLAREELQEFKKTLEVAIKRCELVLGLLLRNANVSGGQLYLAGRSGFTATAIQIDDLLDQSTPDPEPSPLERVIENDIRNLLPGLPVRSPTGR